MTIDEQNKTSVNFLINQNTSKEANKSNQNNLSFQDMLGSTQKVQTSEDTKIDEEKKEAVDELKKEIKTELRKGMTPDELKAFETLLERIKEKLRDKNVDKKELSGLIDQLQEGVSKLINDNKGESVFKAEDAIIKAKQTNNIETDSIKEVISNSTTNSQSHNQLKFLQGMKNS